MYALYFILNYLLRVLTLFPPSWGQSAGAIAVGHHMITNGGNPEGLFRAAIMNSGSPYSILDVADPVPAQNAYNTFVSVVGCSNATDTLACLRQAPVAKIQSGMDASSGLYSYTVCLWGCLAYCE